MRSKIQDVKRGKPAKMVRGVTHTEHRKNLQSEAAVARANIATAKENVKSAKAGVRNGKGSKGDVSKAERAVERANGAYAKAVTKRDEWAAKNKRIQ